MNQMISYLIISYFYIIFRWINYLIKLKLKLKLFFYDIKNWDIFKYILYNHNS